MNDEDFKELAQEEIDTLNKELITVIDKIKEEAKPCLLYTSPSPRD